MKKVFRISLAIVFMFHAAFLSGQNYGSKVVLEINPQKHTLDENRNGNFAWSQLKPNTKYEIIVSGEAFFGKQKIKGFFVHFNNNKEDGNAERYLFVKSGDKFFINTGESRPFIMAFMVKFYGNRATFRGKFILTVKPLGPTQPPTTYNEDDMYRGIR